MGLGDVMVKRLRGLLFLTLAKRIKGRREKTASGEDR